MTTATKIDLDAALTAQRARRFTDPAFVRCPANCDPKRGCPRCRFWGTVEKDSPEATCSHVLTRVAVIGSCLTEYRCTKCGAPITIDSSD